MDCRSSLMIAVGLSVICVGCTTTSKTNLPNKKFTFVENKTHQAKLWPFGDDSKKMPSAATHVKWGVYRERLAQMATSAEQKRNFYDQARKAYQGALETEPKNLAALQGLARVYAEMRDDERTAKAYKKAFVAYPKNAALRYEFGRYHAREKDWESAVENFSKAVELSPENRDYMKWLGFSHAFLGNEKDSLDWLTKANGTSGGHFALSQALLHLGNRERSMHHLKVALKEDPNNLRAKLILAKLTGGHFAVAHVLLELGDRERGIEHLKLALKQNPNNQRARVLLTRLTSRTRRQRSEQPSQPSPPAIIRLGFEDDD